MNCVKLYRVIASLGGDIEEIFHENKPAMFFQLTQLLAINKACSQHFFYYLGGKIQILLPGFFPPQSPHVKCFLLPILPYLFWCLSTL